MLEIIKDNLGNIKAVCEFYSVNEKGEWDKSGIYCWINEVFVSKSYQNNGCLRKFVEMITSKYPQFQFGYFWRRKKYGNRIRIYHKFRWLKLIRR